MENRLMNASGTTRKCIDMVGLSVCSLLIGLLISNLHDAESSINWQELVLGALFGVVLGTLGSHWFWRLITTYIPKIEISPYIAVSLASSEENE
jgi:hypothetical protein